MRTLLSTGLGLLLMCAAPAAHGGAYKPPADGAGAATPPPGAVPPTNPGGAKTPRPAPPPPAPTSASGPASAPKAALRGLPRGQTKLNRTARVEFTRTTESWQSWWDTNMAAYVDLRANLVRSQVETGGDDPLTGRGRPDLDDASTSRRPSRVAVDERILPPLLAVLGSVEEREILDSAVLALGRSALPARGPEALAAVVPLLAHAEISVQSSAALALGLLGSAEALPLLSHVLADDAEGRRAAGGQAVPWLVRAFAALGLGFLNAPGSAAPLREIAYALPDSERDVKVCAIVALGLLSGNRDESQVRDFLLEALDDAGLDPLIRSFVPTSLGKLGRDAVCLSRLTEVLMDRRTENLVRQSAAIALGQMAEVTDEAAVKALREAIAEGKDAPTRHFAFISLAKIGARDAAPDEHGKTHEALSKLFSREIRDPGHAAQRSWAALAAGIYGRNNGSRRPGLVERVGWAYDEESDPTYRAAFAIALGLLRAHDRSAQLLEDFRETRDEELRGYLAVALGLLDCAEAAAPLRELCRSESIPPTFRLQVAMGLGLLSDVEAVDVLIETLAAAETLGVSAGAARALGLIGDTSAIRPLEKLAQDESQSEPTRAFACVALGLLGEKTELPWSAAIGVDHNFNATVPAIAEALDIP